MSLDNNHAVCLIVVLQLNTIRIIVFEKYRRLKVACLYHFLRPHCTLSKALQLL